MPGNNITCSAEVIGRKIVRGRVAKVVDEPSVTQRAEGYKGNTQFLGRVDEAAGFVDCFKGRVLCLHSIDLGD